MSVLKLKAIDRRLIVAENALLSSGSVGVDTIQIVTDDTWNFENAEYFLTFDDNKAQLKKLGDVLSCPMPPFITAAAGEYNIGIYAMQNESIVKTSTLVNVMVQQGAPTDAIDPFEPIRKEAYEQGKAEGYKEGYTLTKQIVDYYESLTSTYYIGNSDVFFRGNENNLLDFPYINTENLSFNVSPIIGKYVRTIGLDVSSTTSNGVKMSYYTGLSNLEKCILTGIKKAFDENKRLSNYGLIGCWRDCVNLKEIYTDGLGALLDIQGRNQLATTFNGCQNLKIIGGFNKETRQIDNDNFGKIDFYRCTDTTDMFKNCYKLEEVRFTPLRLTVNLNMSQSNRLSQESILSLINALSLAKTATITLHPDVKDLMTNEWWCSFDASTGLYHITDAEKDPMAMAFSNAISAKGWVLAVG